MQVVCVNKVSNPKTHLGRTGHVQALGTHEVCALGVGVRGRDVAAEVGGAVWQHVADRVVPAHRIIIIAVV